MGSESIDVSLGNMWRAWFAFRRGKKWSYDLHEFQYKLEENLYGLFVDLRDGKYKHGSYRTFMVCDNKRREVSVSTIRDRVVHRLIYDYLNTIYDKTFIYDAWSCRVGVFFYFFSVYHKADSGSRVGECEWGDVPTFPIRI